jgi:hypothetical protein
MGKIYKYPSCFGVLGYSRSIIQDAKRNHYIFSPIWLTSVLEKKEQLKISEFKKLMANNNVGSCSTPPLLDRKTPLLRCFEFNI